MYICKHFWQEQIVNISKWSLLCILTRKPVLHTLFAAQNDPFKHLYISYHHKQLKQKKKSKKRSKIDKKGVYQHVFFLFFYVMYVFLDPPPLPRVSIGLVQCVWKHISPLPVVPGTCRCDQVPGAHFFFNNYDITNRKLSCFNRFQNTRTK